jgi:hypothetical protein
VKNWIRYSVYILGMRGAKLVLVRVSFAGGRWGGGEVGTLWLEMGREMVRLDEGIGG